MLVLDVDGVMTDGQLWYGPRGEALKSFNVRDGLGIRHMVQAGVRVAIVTGRKSDAVVHRFRELRVAEIRQGVDNKLKELHKLCKKHRLSVDETACIGDDIPDVEMMKAVALSFAVKDAHPAALAAADRVTRLPGGRGAVREVCDVLLQMQYLPDR